MNMDARTIAELRVLVGYLGEQAPPWWTSQFFSPSAAAFLRPVFARSMSLAQYQGVTAAASRVHDEHIGVGRTFHLFRLPELYEQSAAEAFADPAFSGDLQAHVADRERAESRLGELARPMTASEGPLVLGDLGESIADALPSLAGIYLDAFRKGIRTFPYLREAQ
ncbi:MAG: BrxE family protein [Alphaproteobacteria bacterium]|nr:BrxE family protein [Alphaproteobacteria bacterium]